VESPTYAAKPNDPSIEIARKNADSYLMEWKRNRREVEEKWKRKEEKWKRSGREKKRSDEQWRSCEKT
jgi:hypothetical protein